MTMTLDQACFEVVKALRESGMWDYEIDFTIDGKTYLVGIEEHEE